MKIRASLFFYCFVLALRLAAQDRAELKKTGSHHLAESNYRQALEAYLQYDLIEPGIPEILANIGICYFHLNQPGEAQLFLERAVLGKAPAVAYYYLGKVHHAQLDFEQAAAQYKLFLKKTKRGRPLREATKSDIHRCGTGIRIRRKPALASVIHLGSIVNSEGEEFKPIFRTGQETRLFFSSTRLETAGGFSSRENGSAIFYSDLTDGDWSVPKPLGKLMNSGEHEIALGFLGGGRQLCFFRGEDLGSRAMLMDTLRENGQPSPLLSDQYDSPMHPELGDCSPFWFNDSTLLFASARPGGFGGLDLFVTHFSDGIWSPPANLGPTINSAYDETSPFLAADGRTLFFSTNDVERSMGGHDVLTSTFLDWTGRWSPAENLGLPINSVGDEQDLVLSTDGSRAFFASNRHEGLGGLDLFVAFFEESRREMSTVSQPSVFHQSELPANPPMPHSAMVPITSFESLSTLTLEIVQLPTIGGSLSQTAYAQLDQLSQLLREFPQAKVTIVVHAAPGDDVPAFFQTTSQQLTARLTGLNAIAENISIQCLGVRCPVSAAAAENRRMELLFSKPSIFPFDIQYQVLPETAHAARYHRLAMSNLCFRPEFVLPDLTAHPEMVDRLFQLYPNGTLTQQPVNGALAFSPGIYLSPESAADWANDLQQNGFPNAAVNAFVRGWRVEKGEEAAKLLDEFPQLKHFLEKED